MSVQYKELLTSFQARPVSGFEVYIQEVLQTFARLSVLVVTANFTDIKALFVSQKQTEWHLSLALH